MTEETSEQAESAGEDESDGRWRFGKIIEFVIDLFEAAVSLF